MKSFLRQSAEYIKSEFDRKYHEICIVLPGKRGVIFLKEHLKSVSDKPLLLPEIISVEEFMQKVSGLQQVDPLTLSLELFQSWEEIELKTNSTSPQLRDFLKWSNTVIHDFNEVDRSLASADSLFKNLSDIKDIEHWSLSKEELSDFQKRYLKFMNNLGELYHTSKSKLLKKGQGWPGLVSRVAAENPKPEKFTGRFDTFIFCGFNALNACEKKLFKSLQIENKAKFLWDADHYYLEDEKQEAGNFLRQNFTSGGFRIDGFISDHLIKSSKNIQLIAAAGSMSQALIASKKINELYESSHAMDSTAVILADENLLHPVISSMPEIVDGVNITLEYPLKLTSLYDLFNLIMLWQSKAEEEKKDSISIYYKDFFRFYHNPCIKSLFEKKHLHELSQVLERIIGSNLVFISPAWLLKNWAEPFQSVSFLFEKWANVETALENLYLLHRNLLDNFRSKQFLSDSEKLEIEYLHGFNKALITVTNKHKEYPSIKDLTSLFHLIKEVVSELSVSFIGEPLNGLQVMGVLESRTLDFKNIILVGMNEGKLPSGPSQNSFIPNDLKRFHGLPLTREKDAVFAYHFYRLLQRAENICLIYNTESDRFGAGEKSRFLTQIQSELKIANSKIQVSEYIASSGLPVKNNHSICINKKDSDIALLIEKFTKGYGLSASSINAYNTCALRFWYNYVAGIKENEEIEEGMEAGTFGIILHKCLEDIYKPFEGNEITQAELNKKNEELNSIILKVYTEFFPEEKEPKGKNLLANNILHLHLERQIKEDCKSIKSLLAVGKKLNLMGVEKDFSGNFVLNRDRKDIPFKIQGRIDRVDFYGEEIRIIDYKSSVNSSVDNFVFTGIEDIFNNGNSKKNNTKMIQLFLYAWLAWKNNFGNPENFLPAIIPFKNYTGEPVYLVDQSKKKLRFTEELLMEFEGEIKKLLSSILNKGIPFNQTSDTSKCEYCSYSSICMR